MAANGRAVNRIEAALRGIAGALEQRGKRYALVGGLAVSARAEPRFTRDVDVAVAVADDAEAEALVHELVQIGYVVLATVEQDVTGRLSTVRLAPRGEASTGIVVDILFASSGIEAEVVDAAQPIEAVPSLTLPIASVGHLMALKILAQAPNRPQDSVDLHALVTVASPNDLETALNALKLIEHRGFNRGRDLVKRFQDYVSDGP